MTKFKLDFSKYCDACGNKIRWYHRLDFVLTDVATNKIIRKDTPSEILDQMEVSVDLFHARCLRQIVNDTHSMLYEYMKQNKGFVRDEDLR